MVTVGYVCSWTSAEYKMVDGVVHGVTVSLENKDSRHFDGPLILVFEQAIRWGLVDLRTHLSLPASTCCVVLIQGASKLVSCPAFIAPQVFEIGFFND